MVGARARWGSAEGLGVLEAAPLVGTTELASGRKNQEATDAHCNNKSANYKSGQ